MAFKSSRGRELGKGNIYYKSSSLGLGYGGGAGGSSPLIITGGATYTPGNGYKYHVFTADNTFVTTGDLAQVEVFMVAGGGGGGSGGGGTGGGGGAGGVRFYPSLPVAAGEYTITIGQGGQGAPNYDAPGTAGGNTTAFGKTATGGGHSNYNYTSAPVNGGSGAGSSYNAGHGSGNAGGADNDAAPSQEGYSGGGGGGGGAGENGQPTAGGNGLQFPNFAGPLIGQPSLDPYNGYFAGGGGSGKDGVNGAPGGNGGGGHGQSRNASSNGTITAGVDMLGSGGGGGSNVAGADGGNGIVVVRYAV
tara:strand:- start:547 stop:1458 length:912 start_codon:yes stop_codon:yes gene_type:complete